MIVLLHTSIDISPERHIAVMHIGLGLAEFDASLGALVRECFDRRLAVLDNLAAMLQVKVAIVVLFDQVRKMESRLVVRQRPLQQNVFLECNARILYFSNFYFSHL